LEILLTTPSLEIKFHNQLACTMASKHATNSASMVDATITDYFALFHPLAKKYTQPNVDFLVSVQATKSESV